MSINGITPNPLANIGSLQRPDAARPNGAAQTGMDRAAQATPNARANQMASLKPQTPLAAPTQNSVPAEAPAGTDPELWNVLTSEERNFFAKTSALGPLTYGRYKAAVNPATPPAARGVRLDVRA
ncbi:MAG: hypothetical protein K2R93_07130 [Gemmatimonadaceae bacterium]|nr:hypothetical protein [Gemmatimonadaceae bacterium]